MSKRLQIAVMATATATFLLLAPVARAGSDAPIRATTDKEGRTIYVNDGAAPATHAGQSNPSSTVPAQMFRSQQNRLVYWSSVAHRWKPVPHANVQAAQSAAAEVSDYLGKTPGPQNSP